MRYVFVISTLGPGGAERVLAELATHFSRKGNDVSVATFEDVGVVDFYPLPPGVQRRFLGNPQASGHVLGKLAANFDRVLRLRRLLRELRPAAVLAFMDTANVTAILATIGLPIRVVASERTDPGSNTTLPRLWRHARRLTYRFADIVVAQTEGAAIWLRQHCHCAVRVIPNALRPLPQADQPRQPLLLTVGRLDRNKGVDVVLEAFGQVHQRFPAWRLAVVGDGPLRESLVALAQRVGIGAKIEWVGATREVETWYARASLLALGSRFEGFPNVLLEAMGMGLAVVSTDCRSGPADLVRHGHDGLLVPVDDVAAMAAAMETLMSDESERLRLGVAALEVRQRYAPNVVFPHWEAALAPQRSHPGAPPPATPSIDPTRS